MQSSSDAIIGKTLDGVITTWNPAAEQLYGYIADEVIGEHISMIVPADKRAELADIMARVNRGESVERRETVRVRKDGQPIEVSLSISPIRDDGGRLVGAATIAHSITRERRAREAQELFAEASSLLALSLDFRETLQAVAHLMVPRLADYSIVDLLEDDGRVHRVAVAHRDPGLERLLSESEAYMSDPSSNHPIATVLQSTTPLVMPRVAQGVTDALALSAAHHELIERLEPRSLMLVPLVARERTLGVLTMAATAASGRQYGTDELALARDVAYRCALAVDNARLYLQAQRAIRARDEVLASVSHDLKNPLTVIKGQSALLRKHIEADTGLEPHRVQKGLDLIERAATNMTAWIDDLLDAARLQIGRPLELRCKPTDLVELAWGVAAEHQQTTGHHRVRVDTTESSLVGLWDPQRLTRVLANLVTNAIKYSPGGGDVTIRLRRETSSSGGAGILTVCDQGIGIPRQEQARVFDRFFRATNVAGRYAGTGLGLSGAKQIVEQHGGTLSLSSEERAGTIVTLRLPLSAAALAA